MDFLTIFKEVMFVGAIPVEVVGIVINVAAVMAKGIVAALAIGECAFVISQVPFSDVRCGVSGVTEIYSHRS